MRAILQVLVFKLIFWVLCSHITEIQEGNVHKSLYTIYNIIIIILYLYDPFINVYKPTQHIISIS